MCSVSPLDPKVQLAFTKIVHTHNKPIREKKGDQKTNHPQACYLFGKHHSRQLSMHIYINIHTYA